MLFLPYFTVVLSFRLKYDRKTRYESNARYIYYFRFTWYVNGVQVRDAAGQFEVYYPMANRCIARFPIPQKGEYKVIAENRAGKEHSIGYIDVKKGNNAFLAKYFFIKFII